MNRRNFFRNSTLAALGTTIFNPFDLAAKNPADNLSGKSKKAQNIIFLVSDGMSTGTLNMADLYLQRKNGKGSQWLELYKENRVSRALMDTASLNSIVTDSSAASSSWGGGNRVNNGALNVGPNGEKYLPILQKFKKSGKKVGCVTTVAITHATPAGFCVNSASRSSQDEIAAQYLDLEFDVMLGGGNQFFDKAKRKDQRDLYAEFKSKGYSVSTNRSELEASPVNGKLLGIFAEDALPYYIDRNNDENLKKSVPTLAEMTQKAIESLQSHPKGFVIQVESGKVDWAAHANDIAGLIHDQVQFDEAIKVAIDFAEKDKNTLVIITSDHGNANPGIIYGKEANANFDRLQKYSQTNEWILNAIKPDFSNTKVIELIESANATAISDQDAKTLLSYYDGLHKSEEGLYNYKKLPFKAFAEIQKKTNSVGWISMDHSADYVELAMFGPGSERLKPFVKNTDLHYFMLDSAEVENRF